MTLDLNATRDGEDVAGLNTEDWSYEVGQGWVADDFDDQLIGASAGDELTFTATPKGTEEPADFVVTVTPCRSSSLPELTDEFVAENFGELETVEAWRASIAERMSESKLNQARQELVRRVTDALTGLTEIEPPEPLVQSDLQRPRREHRSPAPVTGHRRRAVVVDHRPGRQQLRRGHEGCV